MPKPYMKFLLVWSDCMWSLGEGANFSLGTENWHCQQFGVNLVYTLTLPI